MKVAKWGNSLAVRIPTAVAEELNLKEGDEIELSRIGENSISVKKQVTADDVIKAMQQFRDRVPADFKFDRDEANAR